jgi:pimeloyl-ACP methyl ester carboxylesterase
MVMDSFRKYGTDPIEVAVIHGGPGAPGGMAPVAKELSKDFGVIEPFQSGQTVESQVEELHTILKRNVKLPVKLVGWSWGAMLSFIFSSRYPDYVQKLILINSAVFEDKYSLEIMNTRINRMDIREKLEFLDLTKELNNPESKNKNEIFARLGELILKADTFQPIKYCDDVIEYQFDIYRSVWDDARKIRKSGDMLELGKKISCPVVAIHGDYDPHPAEGIKKPLLKNLKDFKFVLIEKCGHYPWFEKNVKEKFYSILRQELES